MPSSQAFKLQQSGIQVVDFQPFLDGSARQQVADTMLESFKTTGFVYLVNHGLSQDGINKMFQWSREFFSQSVDIKQLAPHPASGAQHRGYSAPGVEKVTQHVYDAPDIKEKRMVPDVKESFEVGREDDPVMTNIWLPDGILPGFKEACLDFFWIFRSMEENILRALAIGFHLSEDYFLQFHKAADNQLRLLHYPSVPLDALKDNKISRIDGHSDFGSITLLLQDEVGGLEIENPNEPGNFSPAPPIENSIIVNAGDFLMRWSNDTIKSTVHRVRAPPDVVTTDGMVPERYSIPYFCSADFGSTVDCIPGTWSAENPKRYEPISAGENIIKRLTATYY